MLSSEEFRVGLVVGVTLALAVVFVHNERRPRFELRIAGLLIALGFVVAVTIADRPHATLAVGTALLGAAGYGAGHRRVPALAAPALALPGALVLAAGLDASLPAWVGPGVVLATVLACPLVADFEHRFQPAGWTGVLYAVGVGGVYATVPDTEQALVLLGVTLPLVLVTWPTQLAPFGRAGAYAAIGALLWVAAGESRGREAAFVGAIGCLGLLVAEPLARIAGRGSDTLIAAVPRRPWAVAAVGATQLLLVWVGSRLAGMRTNVAEATLIVAFELAVAVTVLSRGYVRTSP